MSVGWLVDENEQGENEYTMEGVRKKSVIDIECLLYEGDDKVCHRYSLSTMKKEAG